MTFLYLDASARVKRYYRERGSDRIQELLTGADPRVCSVLGLMEVIATLARKRQAQEITLQDFDRKLAEIERDWQTFLRIELTVGTLDHAKNAAARLALRGADAGHFAALCSLERRVAQSGHRVVPVAPDRELKELPRQQGLLCSTPKPNPPANHWTA